MNKFDFLNIALIIKSIIGKKEFVNNYLMKKELIWISDVT